jgi:hypothetical protein
MKSGKYIDLDVNDNFKCGYGTVDSKNLKSIYTKISCWIVPTISTENWSPVIGGLKRKISSKINESLKSNPNFKHDRYIVDLDIRASGLERGKKSYMNCEITLFTNGSHEIKEDPFKGNISNLISSVIDESVVKYDKFSYHKNKRG